VAERDFAVAPHSKPKGLAGGASGSSCGTRETATNPAGCEAFVLAIIAGWRRVRVSGTEATRDGFGKAAHQAAHASRPKLPPELRRIAPNAGSYVSESNYFNKSLEAAIFGGEELREAERQ